MRLLYENPSFKHSNWWGDKFDHVQNILVHT